MAQLVDSALTSRDVKHYAQIVKKKSINRKFKNIITSAKQCIENNNADSYEIMDKLSSMFMELNTPYHEDDGYVEDDLLAVMDQIEKNYKNGGKHQLPSTYCPILFYKNTKVLRFSTLKWQKSNFITECSLYVQNYLLIK